MINQVPTVLVSDFYGSIAVIVAFLLGALNFFNAINEFNIIIVALLSITLRLLAFKRGWHLPRLNK